MRYRVVVLFCGLLALPVSPAPADAQGGRTRVALVLSDTVTTVRRWAAIDELDSLLPRYLARSRLQYISRADMKTVTEGDGRPPSEWSQGDVLALGALLRAEFMIELRVEHAPERETFCARVLRVSAHALADSVCVRQQRSTISAIRELAPELGRRLNRLSALPGAGRPIPAPPGSAEAPARADSIEMEVLRTVLAYWKAKPGDFVTALARWPLCSRAADARVGSACLPDTLRAEFGVAAEDYVSRQRRGTVPSESTLAALGLRVARVDESAKMTSCTSPTTYLLSNPGLDSSTTKAVVVASIQRGRGPSPGCGSALGTTFLLRRSDNGEWSVVGTLGEWRT